MTLEQWQLGTQQFLENWMEHFDRRLDELVAIQNQLTLPASDRFLQPDKWHTPSLKTKQADNDAQGNQAKESVRRASASSAETQLTSIVRFSEDHRSDCTQQGAQRDKSVASARTLKQVPSALHDRPTMQARMSELYAQLQTNRYGIQYEGIEWIVRSSWFENVISGAIVTNGILIGVQVEFEAREVDADRGIFTIAEGVFFTIFSLELLLRIVGLRSEWVKSVWNFFDAGLVLTQLVEFIIKFAGGDADVKGTATGRMLRVLRIARIARVARLLRFFAQLRFMVKMIAFSLESLFWLGVLLLIMIYVMAIIFTQGATDYMKEENVDQSRVVFLEEYFCDVATSSLSLLKSFTNGVGWAVISDELFGIYWTFGMLFVLFVFFVFFSVLNVVTGLFVDGAIQHAGQERELLVAAERKALEGYCSKLTELLVEIDTNGSGTISLEELFECAKDPTLANYLQALEIHTPETGELFCYLDRDGSGEIDIREFIDGCLRIRGGARSIDMHMMLFRLERQVADAFIALDQEILELHSHIADIQSGIGFEILHNQPGNELFFAPTSEIPSDQHFGKSVRSAARLFVSTKHDDHMSEQVVFTPRSPRSPP